MPKTKVVVAEDLETDSRADKKRSNTVRQVALALGRKLKAQIEILFVEDVRSLVRDREATVSLAESWVERDQQKIHELGQFYPRGTRSYISTGFAPARIPAFLKTRPESTLTVMGTHGRTGLDRILLGSVAEEVIRRSSRPVVVVGPVAQGKKQPLVGRTKPRILIATDLGLNSEKAETVGLSLAKRLSAEVTLIHDIWTSYPVYFETGLEMGYSIPNLHAGSEERKKNAESRLRKRIKRFQKQGISCELKIVDGSARPSRSIVTEAAKGYSLVVMGTHGRNALITSFIGSAARETILGSRIPVVVVHSKK